MITVVMVQARRRATHRFVIMGNWLSQVVMPSLKRDLGW